MNARFSIGFAILLAAAFSLSGCDKVKKALNLGASTTVVVAAATPSPVAASPQVEATPAPQTTPEPSAPLPNPDASVIALCYHRFEDRPKDYLAIKPEEFEAQMAALKENGFTVIPMQDFLAWRRGEKVIPAKSALITIDDGYRSGYEVAWPILKKFGYPFTMFIYIAYVGSGGQSLTWDQLAEMRDAGVDIQAHSVTHQNLHGRGGGFNKAAAAEVARMGYEPWLAKEIGGSRQALEQQLGVKVNVFAYPYGAWNDKARAKVKEAGFEAAFTVYGQRLTLRSPYDLLGRYAVSSRDPKIFQSALQMVGGGVSAPSAEAAPAMMAAAAPLEAKPAPNATIEDPRPLIEANLGGLANAGRIDPASVVMRISGIGPVPVHYDAASKTARHQIGSPALRAGNTYTVIIGAKAGAKRVETSWSFTVK